MTSLWSGNTCKLNVVCLIRKTDYPSGSNKISVPRFLFEHYSFNKLLPIHKGAIIFFGRGGSQIFQGGHNFLERKIGGSRGGASFTNWGSKLSLFSIWILNNNDNLWEKRTPKTTLNVNLCTQIKFVRHRPPWPYITQPLGVIKLLMTKM